MENYIQIRVLGKGSFGSAWLVQRRNDKTHFVAKEVRLTGMKPAERESAKHEIDVLRTLNHPNITRYVDHFEHRGSLYIVMEYANGGDLYTKIKQRKGARFTEKEILHFFSQLCLALLHLHDRHILHRDLKTQNVFLTTDGVVKLGDFGISTVLRNTFELKRTVCGTPYYFSPELCLNKPYNNKSDVWALGCILYELTTLTHAFDGTNMKCLVQKILKGVYPPIHSSYSVNLSKLISGMLQIDPVLRPNVSQIISLPYIRESLSNLQRAVEVAQCDKRPCNPSEGKVEQARPQQWDVAVRIEERRREEQAKAMKLAKERQEYRVQVEQRQRENEERLQKLQVLQREAEIAREKKRKELEARVREQRRQAERRARAQALIHKQREEEWERNRREHAEECKRKEREEERLAQERNEQNIPREGVFNNKNINNDIERPERRVPSAMGAVELYREMRRQAALNKQRMMEEMGAAPERQQPFVVPVAEPRRQTPPNLPQPNGRQQRVNSLGKMTPEEAEEVRRQIFWQMRREALENKRRALGLDEAEVETAQKRLPLAQRPQKEEGDKQQQQEQEQPALSPRPPLSPPLQEKNKLQGQHEEEKRGGNPIVYAKRMVLNREPRIAEPSPCLNEVIFGSPDGESAVPDDGSRGMRRREEDFNALHTAIDAALTKGNKPTDLNDFNDEAFPDIDPTKFMLDGQTLVLPNVQATDPLMHRIESLRLFLELNLGEAALIGAYRQMNSISADDDEAMQRAADALPEEHQKYIPLIAQLIVCEDAFNRQLLQ